MSHAVPMLGGHTEVSAITAAPRGGGSCRFGAGAGAAGGVGGGPCQGQGGAEGGVSKASAPTPPPWGSPGLNNAGDQIPLRLTMFPCWGLTPPAPGSCTPPVSPHRCHPTAFHPSQAGGPRGRGKVSSTPGNGGRGTSPLWGGFSWGGGGGQAGAWGGQWGPLGWSCKEGPWPRGDMGAASIPPVTLSPGCTPSLGGVPPTPPVCVWGGSRTCALPSAAHASCVLFGAGRVAWWKTVAGGRWHGHGHPRRGKPARAASW